MSEVFFYFCVDILLGCAVLAERCLWGTRWLYSAVRLGGCVGDKSLEVEGIWSVAEMLGGLNID